MHEAKLGDIYRDADGRIWQVIATCAEPTVKLVRLEDTEGGGMSERKHGGVSGFMWDGFERIYEAK